MNFKIKKLVEKAGFFLKEGKTGKHFREQENTEIQISYMQSENLKNVIEFWFKPGKKIRINSVSIQVAEFTDKISGDMKTVYENDNWYLLAGYEGIECGQVWSFNFEGKIDDEGVEFISSQKCKIN